MTFPQRRLRRLRRTAPLRRMVAETRLHPDDLIAPLFVREGIDEAQPIESLPGQSQHTRESLRVEVRELKALGVPALGRYLAGTLSLEEAAAQARTVTRRYAKRQLTWLRHQIRANLTLEAQYSESLWEKVFAYVRENLLTG